MIETEAQLRQIEYMLASLSRSKFRSSFCLHEKERKYIDAKGLDVIRQHTYDFIEKRLAAEYIPNDGRQTPMRGHPVFIAQHATGTCCRKCLYKWHKIAPGKPLTDSQKEYVVDLIMSWIEKQIKR